VTTLTEPGEEKESWWRMSSIGVAAPTVRQRPPGAPDEGTTMKYMIMMFGGLGASLADRSPEWIKEMQSVMMRMDGELRESGEVVDSQHLMDPSQATTVRFQNGAPAPTDGPFAEIKESLAGYWVIEGSHERAVEIALQVVAVTEYPMEIRRVMDQSAQE
jgi:hypothetical protein